VEKDKEKRLEMLKARFNYAEKWRSPLESKCLDWYKLYIGYRKPRTDGRSNLHIPYTLDTIDTYRARLLKALLGVKPYISFVHSSRTMSRTPTKRRN
jgi:hypothetical protein